MTIMTHDRIAIFPKRCNICRRLFWLEPYDIYYKEVGIDYHSLKQIKCTKCRGKWLFDVDNIICSNCGISIDDEIMRLRGINGSPNYCPNCGAKMEGE